MSFPRLIPILITGLLLVLASCFQNDGAEGGAQDWLLFRGNPSMSGYTSRKLPSKPVLLWSYASDARTQGSAVVKDGTTYWSDRRGKIYGVNSEGNLDFSLDLVTPVESTPLIADEVLYLGDNDGRLTAVSLTRKDTLWQFHTQGQISAPANRFSYQGQDQIVVGSYDYFMYSVDAASGQKLGSYESGYYINGGVAMWDHYAVFGGCDSWVRMIDCVSGQAVDSIQLAAYIPSSPAIQGRECFVSDYSGVIYRIRLGESGFEGVEEFFTPETRSNSQTSVPALTPDDIYFVSSDNCLYCMNRKDGSLRWKTLLKGDSGDSSPVVADDKVLVCSDSGIITILDAVKGTILWEYDAGERITASPSVLQGRFLVLTVKGTLLCFGNE